MYERTADTPWCAVPLLDDGKEPTLWFASDMEAMRVTSGKAYSIQYRPRKRRVKPKTIKTNND